MGPQVEEVFAAVRGEAPQITLHNVHVDKHSGSVKIADVHPRFFNPLIELLVPVPFLDVNSVVDGKLSRPCGSCASSVWVGSESIQFSACGCEPWIKLQGGLELLLRFIFLPVLFKNQSEIVMRQCKRRLVMY